MCICCFVLLARFMQLIQREWLDGGHPFSMRHNHVTSAPEKEKAPMFLLFLDAVWQVRLSQSHVCIMYLQLLISCQHCVLPSQVTQQFPLSFEFNDRFLHALFVHSYSSDHGKSVTVWVCSY